MLAKIATAILLIAPAPSTAAEAPNSLVVLRDAARAMGRLPLDETLDGRGSITAEGRTGEYRESVRSRDGAYRMQERYSLLGEAEGYDGHVHWKQDRSGASHELNAPFTKADRVATSWIKLRVYLRPGSARLDAVTHDTLEGRRVTILTMTPTGGNPVRLAFDDISHFLVRVERNRPLDTITERYGDYHRVGAAMLPYTIDVEESGDHKLIRMARYDWLPDRTRLSFSRPAPPRDTNLTGSATLPLEGESFAVVPATINGRQFDFILDTGGHNIVTPEVAAELGLTSEGSGSSGGSGPGRAATSDTRIAELKLGSAVMTNQHFTVLDLGNAVKRKNKPPMAGILGLEIFERMAVTVDEPHNRLTIAPFAAVGRCEGDRVPLLFDDDQPAVRGTIDGISAQVGIDVGNGGLPIVLWRWAEAHKVADRLRNGASGSGSGVGGSNTTYRTAHHDIVIGRTALKDVDVNYATTPTGYFSSRADSMNLGHALLQKYAVRFDYSRMEMCVMRPATASAGSPSGTSTR